MALQARVEIGDGILGSLLRTQQRDPVHGPFGQHQLHDRFAPASEGGGRTAVVGVAATADHGRVAYPAGRLVQRSPGGSSCRQIAGGVERDRADRIVLPAGKGLVWDTGLRAGLGSLKALPLAVNHQALVLDQGHSLGASKLFGAGAGKVDVGAAFEHQAGGLNRVLQPLHAGHGARSQGLAIHQQSVELHPAIGGEKAAQAGIKGFIVFEQGDGMLDRVQGGGSLEEQFVARLYGP